MQLRRLVIFAWKNLWAHKMRAFLTISGVTLGIAAIVFLVSLGFGLERLVTSHVANFEAFTLIDVPAANLKTGKINQDVILRLQETPHIVSIDEVVDIAGRVRLSSQNSTAETVVVGVQPNYFKLAEIPVTAGRLFGKEAVDEILVNKALASILGYQDNEADIIGQSISLDLIIPEDLRARDEVEGPVVKNNLPAEVVGVVDESANPIMFVPLRLVTNQGVVNRSSLKAKIDDRKNVEVVRESIENTGYSTEYVGDTVDQISQVFTIFRFILGGFGLIALLVAALGTFNTLTISLMERIREVGLLKTLGMKQQDIFRLFIAESVTIGILGGLLGIAVGSLMGAGLNSFLHSLAARAGAEPVTVYFSPPLFIILVGFSSMIVGFLTGFYPANRAIKTNPLDVIRYE